MDGGAGRGAYSSRGGGGYNDGYNMVRTLCLLVQVPVLLCPPFAHSLLYVHL